MPKLLILGGSADHLGGVEAFCERSGTALATYAPDWEITRLPTSTAYLRPGKLAPYLRGLAALARHRRTRPDLVWLQYVNLPDLSYLLLARSLGLRVMVTPHLGSNWRSQENPLLRRASAAALAQAQRIALISPTQAEEIALPADVPRSLIRNFLPPEILTGALPDLPDGPLQLIHSGRLSEGKGSHQVIEIAARLRDMGVPFGAKITGGTDAAFRARLDGLVAQHRLEGQVALLGRVPEDDLLAHLRGADVLVHPSRIDSYPLIVLEAIASGALAVCLDLAGARDMVTTYGGAIVSAADPVGESAGWIAAQDPATLRTAARKAAGEVRADYAWARCAGALDRALKACLAGDRGATAPDPRA